MSTKICVQSTKFFPLFTGAEISSPWQTRENPIAEGINKRQNKGFLCCGERSTLKGDNKNIYGAKPGKLLLKSGEKFEQKPAIVTGI
jgi:hypothetical protein